MSQAKFDTHWLNSKTNWFIMGTPRGSNMFKMTKKKQWMWKQRLKDRNLLFSQLYGGQSVFKEVVEDD